MLFRSLDQRLLPKTETYLRLENAIDVANAISQMVVRGAPAIGITAAYGVALSAINHVSSLNWKSAIDKDIECLSKARPTAINLHWALEEMRKVIANTSKKNLIDTLCAKATKIHNDDIEANLTMGKLGAELILPGSSVLTHCNAGALATGGYGTALGVIRSAWRDGKIKQVYADETRPWMQGSRLTAWELIKDGIPTTLIADGAAAHLMKTKKIDWVIVGSDRIAANGDVANKIGTYSLAVNARYHDVKFMVVAPTSTIDNRTLNGDLIPIEERSSNELLKFNGQLITVDNAEAWNPVFDIVPINLVDVIVTETGCKYFSNRS